ncbi:hypothetical protein BG015_007614 [Linnemannia schmuckeri]|uniref:Uncharacterized protein n=1 Tax=Linnemannia schmuckeri TaxID=64567 RepID=A0A9P5RY96_9FUNG|nr:hypothetical protein BG015_007614 [Linnemannia schmuckeri]
MLRPRKFIELDSVAEMILNEDWDLHPSTALPASRRSPDSTVKGYITFSTRLDKEETLSLGGAAELMVLDMPQSSKAVKIFLNAGRMEQTIVLTRGENACETPNRNRIAQL